MSKFQGSYVRDVEDCLIASALAGVHAILSGPPGCGKTAISRAVASKIAPGNETVFIRLDASTPPERVKGIYDMELLLTQTKFQTITAGTVYDQVARIVILDEFGRPSDPVFDTLIDGLDRQDVSYDDAPVIWGTTNFLPTSERTQALIDRVAMYLHIPKVKVDIKDVVTAQMQALGGDLTVNGNLPTWKEIAEVRKARPNAKTIEAVADALYTLATEAAKGVRDNDGNVLASYEINHRRLAQWQKIVYRCAVYYGGNADFTTIPAAAMRPLQWAWPTMNETEARNWQAVCNAVVDPVATALDAVKKAAYQKFESIAKMGDQQKMALELGKALSDSMAGLNVLDQSGTDARIPEAILDLKRVFGRIVAGENPFKEGDDG